MCKYCNEMLDKKGNNDNYASIDLSKKKVLKIGDLGIEIVLSMEYGKIENGKERELALVASLFSSEGNELFVDSTIVRKPIKFCPFCGAKL